MTKERIVVDVLLLVTLLTGLAPLLLLVSAVGAFRYERFYECIIAGWLFELLYGTGLFLWPFPYPMFTGSLMLFLVAHIIHRSLRSSK